MFSIASPSIFNSFNAVFFLGFMYSSILYVSVGVFYRELLLLAIKRPIYIKGGVALFFVLPLAILASESLKDTTTLVVWMFIASIGLRRVHRLFTSRLIDHASSDIMISDETIEKLRKCTRVRTLGTRIDYTVVMVNIIATVVSAALTEFIGSDNLYVHEFSVAWIYLSTALNVVSIIAYVSKDYVVSLFWLAMFSDAYEEEVLVEEKIV